MTHTPQQLADFAKLIGITPDTHRYLFKHRLHCCECGSVSRLAHGSTWVCSNDSCPAFDYGFFGAKGYKQAQRLVAELPPLDTPEGDDVYLAPYMRWLVSQRVNYKVGPSLADKPQEAFAATSYPDDTVYAPTATLALVRARQAARVPEIVAIFGEGEG
jgi:hypothetical protein